MAIAQAMENLVGEIRSATTARGAFLTNLRQDVKKHRQGLRRQMNDIHNENRSKARELRGKLTSEERSRWNTARQETERRRVAISELRSNIHSFLNRSQLELRETARALQEKISSEINNIHRAVNDIRRAAKSMLGEFAADLRGAHQAWAGIKKK